MTFSDQSQFSGGNANTSQETSEMRSGKIGNENLSPDSSSSVPQKVPKIITTSDAARLACATPITDDDLLLIINTKPNLEFKSENGATFIRATSRDGKISIQSFKNLKGGNIFRDAGIVKIESGIMSKGKFQPMPNQFQMKKISVASAIEKQTTENQNMSSKKNKKSVAKKETAKSENKKSGKIAFVDELLLSGKHTKQQVAEALNKEYGVNMMTAKNTVSWCASTMKERTGKVLKHLPSERAAKVAPKKVATLPKRTKKVAAPETATV